MFRIHDAIPCDSTFARWNSSLSASKDSVKNVWLVGTYNKIYILADHHGWHCGKHLYFHLRTCSWHGERTELSRFCESRLGRHMMISLAFVIDVLATLLDFTNTDTRRKKILIKHKVHWLSLIFLALNKRIWKCVFLRSKIIRLKLCFKKRIDVVTILNTI